RVSGAEGEIASALSRLPTWFRDEFVQRSIQLRSYLARNTPPGGGSMRIMPRELIPKQFAEIHEAARNAMYDSEEVLRHMQRVSLQIAVELHQNGALDEDSFTGFRWASADWDENGILVSQMYDPKTPVGRAYEIAHGVMKDAVEYI